MRLSLRSRIAALSAALAALACALAAGGMAYGLYFEEIARVDGELSARGEAALKRVIARPSPLEAPGDCFAGMPGFVAFASGPASKAPVVMPGKMRARLVPKWPPEPGIRAAGRALPHTRIAVFARDGHAVLVAADTAAMDAALRQRLAFLYLVPFFALAGGLGGRWLAGRALRPVSRLAEAADRITAGNLSERLPVPSGSDEIARLADVLNSMLARLGAAFEQSVRFSADASHELRTPLTVMRASIETALKEAGGDERRERLLLDLLDEVAALTAIADNLLLLARFDAGAAPARLAPLDLSALTEEATEDAAMLGESRAIRVHSDIAPDVTVAGDAGLLHRLLLNLLGNAVRHNREGGEVRVALRAESGRARLTVSNTGAPIPPEDAERLFTRFFRPGGDRTRDTGGSGLGLSLCREIAHAHAGEIRLVASDAEATTFEVELPVAAER